MPVPIRPIGYPSDREGTQTSGSQFIGLDVDAIAAALSGAMGKSSSIGIAAEARDPDAELLFDLWSRGKIIAEAEAAEEKRYAVPEGFRNDDLMRLKAASLVHGDSNVIKFTSKAIRVIKTIVLAEQNAFTKDAVKKPYSIILAENRAKAATRSTLAFERTASAAPIVVEAQRNIPIDDRYMPQRDTPYIASRRIVLREGTSNKQYIVRMYEVNGQYSVIAWNGRNEPGRSLTLQPKGSFRSRSQAQGVFDDLISSKRNEGYESANDTNHPDLLGVPPQTTRPVATPAPAPAAPRPVRRSEPPTPRTQPAEPPRARAPVSDPVKPKPVIDQAQLDADVEGILSDIDGDLDFNNV